MVISSCMCSVRTLKSAQNHRNTISQGFSIVTSFMCFCITVPVRLWAKMPYLQVWSPHHLKNKCSRFICFHIQRVSANTGQLVQTMRVPGSMDNQCDTPMITSLEVWIYCLWFYTTVLPLHVCLSWKRNLSLLTLLELIIFTNVFTLYLHIIWLLKCWTVCSEYIFFI